MAELEWADSSTTLPRYQWESSSGTFWASQSNNCGPTSVTKIADLYKQTHYGIESTRRLVTYCCVPTTCTQQAAMLTVRGVPALPVWIDRLGQIDDVVGWGGNHPMVIGMEMSRVPYYIKDHTFNGWHAVVILKRATRNGVDGYLVNDPNFSPPGGNRPDPDGGKKFYPKWVIDYAYIRNSVRWAVVPAKPKYVAPPSHRALGDPMADQKTYRNELGRSITVRYDKPIRAGFTIQDRVLRRTNKRVRMPLIGRIKLEDLPWDERQFGPVFLVNTRAGSDTDFRIGYVKQVDCVDGSYR